MSNYSFKKIRLLGYHYRQKDIFCSVLLLFKKASVNGYSVMHYAFFTIWYHRRAEEKRLAIDVPGLLGDHTECTCGFLFSPSDSLILFSI